jgi:hypothetical protein
MKNTISLPVAVAVDGRFVVEYGADKDKKLDWHVDDSDVTLNVCLGKEFVGGDLVFSGTLLLLTNEAICDEGAHPVRQWHRRALRGS